MVHSSVIYGLDTRVAPWLSKKAERRIPQQKQIIMASKHHVTQRMERLVTCHPVWVGLLLRLGLAWFLPWLLDDGRFLPGVAYTDIDL